MRFNGLHVTTAGTSANINFVINPTYVIYRRTFYKSPPPKKNYLNK